MDSDNTLRQPDGECAVLVIGGGPAGSTIAALLAQSGHDVVLLEKDTHPRFHIGESLLPLNLPLFEQLGIKDEVEKIGLRKYSAEFVSPWHGDPVTYHFSDAWNKSLPYAYQVRRSAFDHLLIKNAAARGAKVIEGCKVRKVDFHDGHAETGATAVVDVAGTSRTWRTRFVVDATGRDTLLANQFGIKERNRKHNSAALFGHFTGARRFEGKAEGNISIYWFDHGWFWLIPLADGTTSVGAVCWPQYLKTRKVEPAAFLLETIALCPAIAERLRDAKLVSPVTATGNYSYKAKRMAGRGYIMLGDAFAFIDPVFSSGVYLAMKSGFEGAKAVEICLRDPSRADSALKAFDREIRRGLGTFSWFIYRVTTPTLRNLFMAPRNILRVQEAVMSLLAGDVFGGSPIQSRLALYKAIYYIKSFLIAGQSLAAWKKRRGALRAGEQAGI
jgi:flavin-dependent dehydrogenase